MHDQRSIIRSLRWMSLPKGHQDTIFAPKINNTSSVSMDCDTRNICCICLPVLVNCINSCASRNHIRPLHLKKRIRFDRGDTQGILAHTSACVCQCNSRYAFARYNVLVRARKDTGQGTTNQSHIYSRDIRRYWHIIDYSNGCDQ